MCVEEAQNSEEAMPKVSSLVSAWLAALGVPNTQALTYPSTLRLWISPEHP